MYTAKYESVFMYSVTKDYYILKKLLETILNKNIDTITLLNPNLIKDKTKNRNQKLDIYNEQDFQNLKELSEKVTKEIQIETTGEPPAPYPDEPEKILIFFIGGVTATEVATLRLMSREMFEGRVEFLFGSNEELTCDSFMKQFFPGVYN